jgi:hypothetical protein
MGNIRTECSCGEQHEFDSQALKKMEVNTAPEYVECSECPLCSPELFETPEDHEDEAYKEKVNIDDLDTSLDLDHDIEEFDIDGEEY